MRYNLKMNMGSKKFWKKNLAAIIIIVLVFINIFTVFFLQNRNKIMVNKYPYIDFSRNFINQEHYLSTLQPLREKLKEMTKEFGEDSVSIYMEYLNTGANISINQDLYIWPASLTKVPLALAVMKKVESGKWNLSDELVLMREDSNDQSGDENELLSKYPIGTTFTIEKLLHELLVNSDNTAYFILLRNMDQDELKDVIESLGIEALFTKDGRVSAKEYSRILRSLYTANFLSRENSQKILKLLDDATFNEFISYEIGDLVPLPHKYGEQTKLQAYSDSGIVYVKERPYILSVMIQGDSKKPYQEERNRITNFMREVSRSTYDYVTLTEN